MQIIETKNNLAKIVYNPEQNPLVLSCFLIVRDSSQSFLAQVINLEAKTDKNYAIIKLLFNFDEQGNVVSYNGGMPAVTANIEQVRTQDVLGLIQVSNPLVLGNVEPENVSFVQDMTFLNEKALVCVDKLDEKGKFLTGILPQIVNGSGKIVLFDTMGAYSIPDKIVVGENFKLPLNYDTINFIYEKGLPDASGETKALIQEIFLEVQNYVKQLPEKFIPFENFKSVVDAQYEETQIKELILLKNKLLKFYDEGVFAQHKEEFDILDDALINSPFTIIDVSKFNGELQREIISYVYRVMKGINSDFFSFVEVEDDNTDKKLLKQIFITTNVNTIFIAPYKYKYIKEIKQLSKNLILFAPIQQQEDFAGYNVFLSKLNHNEFIVYGDKTHYIPFIVSSMPEQQEEIPQAQEHETNENPQEVNETVAEEVSQQHHEEQEISEQPQQHTEEQEFAEISQEYNEEQDFAEIPQEYNEEQDFAEVPQEYNEEQDFAEIPQEYDEIKAFAEEPVQEYSEEVPQPKEEEHVQTFAEEYEEVQNAQQTEMSAVDQEIIEDINQMESTPAYEVQNNNENMLTDEDLDFIEQNMSGDTIGENQGAQEQFDESALQSAEEELAQYSDDDQEFEETPLVPVYPAEQPTEPASEGDFVQGDIVMHESYGRGVVEKIISYGDKKLCSIAFDENGKKLLDPAITKLTKM